MKQNHIHRYEKTILGKKGYTVFKCNFPNCTHYIAEKLAKNKTTICNRCGVEMILDARAMKFVKPYCVDCVQTKKTDKSEAIADFLEKQL